MRRIVLILACLGSALPTVGQTKIAGRVMEAGFDRGLRGANVVATSLSDPTQTAGTSTSRTGFFGFEIDWSGPTGIRISHIGFRAFQDTVDVGGDMDYGVLALQPEVVTMETVEVAARRERMTIRGDTVEFFAGGFFVPRYTYAESLVEALPGFEVRGGLVFYLGQPVDRVLIDGRAYFGRDVMEALQTMPIEMIESLQIYDQLPDDRRFSGVDDGSREQVINLVTDPNKRNALILNVAAGGGTSERYSLSSGLNHLNGPKQIRASVSTNNTSQARTGGIARTNTGNLSFADTWDENTRLRLTYVAKTAGRDIVSALSRTYFSDGQAPSAYDETRESASDTRIHTFSGSLRHTLRDRHQFSFSPRLLVLSSDIGSGFLGESIDPATSSRRTVLTTNTAGSTSLTGGFSSDWQLNRDRSGLMASLGVSFSNDDSDDLQKSAFDATDDGSSSPTSTSSASVNRDRSVNLSFGWMNRIGENGFLTLGLDHESISRVVDRRSETIDPGETMARLDSTLSAGYDGSTRTTGLNAQYGFNMGKNAVDLSLAIRRDSRKWEQGFPFQDVVEESDFILNATLNGRRQLGPSGALNASYDISGTPPPSEGLQREVDNSNPLLLSIGNPDIDTSIRHRVRARLNLRDPESQISLSSSLTLELTRNIVGLETFFGGSEGRTVVGIRVPAGGQLTRKANLGDQRKASFSANASKPLDFGKGASLSLNVNGVLDRRPFAVDGGRSESTSDRISAGIGLRAQPAEQTYVRFDYSLARSSVSTMSNSSDYLSHKGQITANTVTSSGWGAQTDFSFQVFNRFRSDFDSRSTNWNIALSYRPPRAEQVSVGVSINDILNEGANLQRTSSELYLESTRNNRLSRHIVFSVRWETRSFRPGNSR